MIKYIVRSQGAIMNVVRQDFTDIKLCYDARLTQCIKDLLETKHLYQNIKIDIRDLSKRVAELAESLGEGVIQEFGDYFSAPLDTTINSSKKMRLLYGTASFIDVTLPETAKVYCAKCKEIQPFNPFKTHGETQQTITFSDLSEQLFVLEYQCQGCKEDPNIFLVKRDGLKFSLQGRSPIEVCPTPDVIPKKFKDFYSDSEIAYNSGQVLAALFLLRTFVEQFARDETANTNGSSSTRADEVLAAYMEKLPEDFKSRFPSLQNVYGLLSSALHKAESDDDLFQKCRENINEHFEARKLFKIK